MGSPVWKNPRKYVCAVPRYCARLSTDYLLLAREVIIVRYMCTGAFIYHNTRRQNAPRVEIMHVLWDANLRSELKVHSYNHEQSHTLERSLKLSGVGALYRASSLHWTTLPLLVWIAERLGLMVRDKWAGKLPVELLATWSIRLTGTANTMRHAISWY